MKIKVSNIQQKFFDITYPRIVRYGKTQDTTTKEKIEILKTLINPNF